MDLSNTEETVTSERMEVTHEGDLEGDASRHMSFNLRDC